MLGFNYTIVHKIVIENKATDAHSRQHEEEGSSATISSHQPTWMKEIILNLGDKEHSCHGIA